MIYISILGYGKIFTKTININQNFLDEYKLSEFIFGLITLGLLGIVINFISNINDFVSYSIVIIGIILFAFFFIFYKNKLNYIFFFLIVVIFSVIFSYYTILNDDFSYHFRTIKNFKHYNIFEIFHERRSSYNSHWLFLHSLIYTEKYPLFLLSITSVFYTLIVIDFFNSLKRNLTNNNFIIAVYSLFTLLFLLGVINSYKEYGTDIPGQLIFLYIFLILFEKSELLKNENSNKILFIIVIISFFSISIKISNVFILAILLFLFFYWKNKIYFMLISFLGTFPFIFWLFQNIIISKCLVWPLPISCYGNISEAKNEMFIIQAFAKSVLKGSNQEIYTKLNDFNWLPFWFESHFPKILETYGIFILLLLIPIIIFRLIYGSFNYKKIRELCFKPDIIFFSIIIFIANIFWFINAPAYRFGIAYNFSLLILFFLPFWGYFLFANKKYFNLILRIYLFIGIIIFSYQNIYKSKKYIDRYGFDWPNVKEGKYLEKLN